MGLQTWDGSQIMPLASVLFIAMAEQRIGMRLVPKQARHGICMPRMQCQQVQPALLCTVSFGGTPPHEPCDSYHVVAAQQSTET